MRHFVTRTLSLILMFFFVLAVSFFGQSQKSPKPVPHSGKATAEQTFKADDGPMMRLEKPIRRERRTPTARKADPDSEGDGDTKPVETPSFRVMGRPREDRLMRGKPFHGDLRSLPQIRVEKFERPEFEGPEIVPVPYPGSPASSQSTSVVSTTPPAPAVPAPTPSSSFEGLDFATWGAGHPPDTNGDVGPTYYIQTINTSIGIFRKSDGVRVAAFTFNAFFNGHFGNLCDTNNFGDPVVVYDTFEDRWIITDFAFKLSAGNPAAPVFQCFAVSQSGDPVGGGWNFYSIKTATTAADAFNDYPKFGIWPDGLYMSSNMFAITGSRFTNVRVWAFNKAQMYAGSPTIQIQSFDAPAGEFTLLPSNARLQAGTPPTGTPNYFSTVFFTNAVSTYKFHVDWNNSFNSTFSGPFISLTPAAFANAPGSVATPAPGTNIDTLAPRLMVQNQYSNIGGVESLWDSHTVRGTVAGTAAPRYYQVDVTGGAVAANTTQAFTFNPDASAINRFMPSVAVDRAGDMALGYTAASSTLPLLPAMRYAGRLAGDAVNTITQTETSLIEGTGTQQTASFTRWGDYSAMSLDPDGCTFWNTNMYYQVNGVNFNTRIGAFAFPSCTPVGGGGTISGTVTATAGGAPIQGATVALGSRTTTTAADGAYSFTGIPAGTYPSITASFPGFNSSTILSVVVSDGATTTVDFSLSTASVNGCLTDTTQADFQGGVPTNADLNASPGDVVLVKPTIDQQNAILSNSGVGINITTWGGQTFTPAVTGQLNRVDINLFCSQCAGTTPDLTLSIQATAAGLPTGPDLAAATITGFNSGAAGYHTATFSSPITLTAGTQYALVIRPTANPSSPPPPAAQATYALTRSSTDVYAGGTRVSGATSGTVWTIPLTGTATTDVGFKTFMDSGFTPSGSFISSIKDSNPSGTSTANWGTLSWTASTPTNTNIQFQAAASNSVSGPFNFVGPDGTAATFFSNGGSLAQFNGMRYLKYQALLSTTDNTVTPTLNDVTICFDDTVNTALVVDPATGTFAGTANLSATLTANGTGVSGKTVSFKLNGNSVGSGVTDGSGLATVTGASLTGINAGSYPSGVSATFAGDAGFTTSSNTAALTVTKADQTITFAPLADKLFSDPDFAVSATASSGLAVTFAASGNCTIAGSTVHLTSVGSCTITASQAGDSNYNPATDVPQTFNIAKGNQTITFGALAGKTFGDADFAVSATASSSLAVSFAASGNCTVAGSTVHITGAGSCTITASQAGDSNFNAAPDVPQTFSIAKADQTITFGALAGKTFGDADFAVSATASSSLAVSFAASGNCTVAGSTVHITGAGSCTVTASQAGDSNFNAAPDVPQSFTIAKADQTITFGALAGKTFGDPDFAVSATASSSLPVAFAASGNCTVAGSTVHITGAGSCTITASQAGNSNYNAAPDVPQSFTIAKADQTISFGALAGKTFGDPDFAVSATASSSLTVSFAASGNCTVAGSTVHITGAGSCTITASQAGNSNYNAAIDVPQSFTIAKANQTITFGALGNKTFGNPDFAVSSTASSGLTVTFAASGSCTVAGSTVHLTGAGTCTITASQAGNVNYNPAADVPQSFTIGKATPTLAVTCPSGAVFDGNLHQCTAVANGVGGATVSGSTGITYSGSPDEAPPAAAGTYPANATFVSDDANYNNATGTGLLVIARATPIVTVSCPGATFNGSPHACAAVATGIGGAAVAGSLTLTYNGGAAPSNAGTYAVIASFTSADTNYNDASGSNSLTIAKASQTITFGALPARNFGTPDFTVAATASSSLAVSFSASGNCTVTGSTVHLTSAGSCTITAAQTGNANFNAATSVAQSFVINPPDDFAITPTLPSVSVTAGQSVTDHITVTPNPSTSSTLTFTCSGLPAKSTCTFAPNPVPPGSAPTDVVLTIATTATTTAALERPRAIYASWLGFTGMGLIGVVVMGAGKKRRKKAVILGAFALMLVLMAIGCGGASMNKPTTVPGTPQGTSTVTVTGSTAGSTHSTTFTLTVN